MMFQKMSFRVFCHATESEYKVRKALTFLTSSEEIKTTKSEGYYGNPIVIMESELSGKRLSSFVENLKSSGVMKVLGNKLEERVDEDCCLYLRFDKQKAYLGQLEIVEHEDVIASKLKLNVFPPKKSTTLKALREYFEG